MKTVIKRTVQRNVKALSDLERVQDLQRKLYRKDREEPTERETERAD